MPGDAITTKKPLFKPLPEKKKDDKAPTKQQLAMFKKALRGVPAMRASKDVSDDSILLLMDIEEFLAYRGPGGLTDHQRKIVDLIVFQGETEKDTGKALGISQQAVCYAVKAGLVKLYKHLRYPELVVSGPVFDELERVRILELYHEGLTYKEIAIELDKSLKSIRNKIRYFRERDQIDVQKRKENYAIRQASFRQG